MMIRLFLLMFIATIILNAKAPFNTLYLEIKKERFEGDKKYLKKISKYKDKLDVMTSIQKIWVDVKNNSYLLIETCEGDKTGLLKYEGKSYTLDFDFNIAWDQTKIKDGKIYDNYTEETPDYKFYGNKKFKKQRIKCLDGQVRKTNRYRYYKNSPMVTESYKKQIQEINNSGMDPEDKIMAKKDLKEDLDRQSTRITEWIWVVGDEEMQIFFKKIVAVDNVKIIYRVKKFSVNDEFDKDIFENTLSNMKVKVVKDK